jgi:hypothetical protein
LCIAHTAGMSGCWVIAVDQRKFLMHQCSAATLVSPRGRCRRSSGVDVDGLLRSSASTLAVVRQGRHDRRRRFVESPLMCAISPAVSLRIHAPFRAPWGAPG